MSKRGKRVKCKKCGKKLRLLSKSTIRGQNGDVFCSKECEERGGE